MRFVLAVILSLFTVGSSVGDVHASDGQRLGRVCMAPVPKPNDQRKSLANPSGGNPRHAYSVRIGRRESIELDYESVHWVEGLELEGKHDVVIYADGVPLESWSFRFSDYTFKNRDKPDLCLFLAPMYLNWQLWRIDRAEDWGPCWSSEPRPSVESSDNSETDPVSLPESANADSLDE